MTGSGSVGCGPQFAIEIKQGGMQVDQLSNMCEVVLLDIFMICAAEGQYPLQGFVSEGSHPRHIVKLEIAPGELQPSRKPQLQGMYL